jgi:hypothetical protein
MVADSNVAGQVWEQKTTLHSHRVARCIRTFKSELDEAFTSQQLPNCAGGDAMITLS